jgi:hypothetical protein
MFGRIYLQSIASVVAVNVGSTYLKVLGRALSSVGPDIYFEPLSLEDRFARFLVQ